MRPARARVRLLAASLLGLGACTGDWDGRSPIGYTGVPQQGAIVWGGFEHVWGYNHRVNSLGDWVGPVECADRACDASVGHSSASGSGSDEAEWRSTGTRVWSDAAWFLQGDTELAFAGADAEGVRLDTTEPLSVALPAELAALSEFAVVLGGFDLYSVVDPDRLAELDITLGEPVRDGDTLSVPLTAGIRLDCDSPECDGVDKLDLELSYVLRVAWLVVAAPEGGLAVTSVDVQNAYTWLGAPSPELTTAASVATATDAVDPAMGAVIPGFQRLSLIMDDDHHYVEWASRVEATADADGAVDVAVDLRFQQWNQLTADLLLSYTESGSAESGATVALLQLPGAWTEPSDAGASTYWNANGLAANSDLPVQRVDASFSVEPGGDE